MMLMCVLQILLFVIIIITATLIGLIAGIVVGPLFVATSIGKHFLWLLPFSKNNSDSSFDHI